MPRSKRLHRDDPEWTRRRTAIEMMYMFDRLSQKKIRDKLEEDGFFVTKSELEAQLRLWNIRKNASANVWRYTDHMLLKRDQQGKASVVYYNRQKVSCNTLKKERSRYQPDTLTRYTTALSPKTPQGMELWIRTPSPAPGQATWPQTLPWLRFQDSVLPTILYLTNRAMNIDLQGPDSHVQMDFSSLHRQFDGDSSRTVSNFTANIASMMPEKAENEIVNRAELILQGTADQAFNEHIKLILYCLSNDMYEIDYDDEMSWAPIAQLIERSGLINQPLNLAEEKDLTLTFIAENLFKLCIDFRLHHYSDSTEGQAANSKIISWLLDSGQNPNVDLIRPDTALCFPLLSAMSPPHFDLAIQLLDAGADIRKSFWLSDVSLLSTLLQSSNRMRDMTPKQRETFSSLFRRLLEDDASFGESPSSSEPSALMTVIGHDLRTADMLIQHGANIRYHITRRQIRRTEFTREISVLGFAVQVEDQGTAIGIIQHILGHVQHSDPLIPVADLITPDMLCVAASQGYNDVIKFCCKVEHTLIMTKDTLFLALCAASHNGHLKTCELLLEYGAPINRPECLEDDGVPSPLHFAALSDDCVITEFLCNHGADTNAGFEADHRDEATNLWKDILASNAYRIWSGIPNIVDKHSIQCIEINPLGAAIIGSRYRDKPESISILTRYGARLPNWAVYHGAFRPACPWIVHLAVEHGANLNWRGPDHKTALQAAINARVNGTGYGESEVIDTLVDAGADTAGCEAELIVLREHWSPSEDALLQDIHDNSGPTACKLSILAAVFLTGSIPKIQQALDRSPGVYDPGALCASVMLAISSGSQDPLRQLLNNRPEAVQSSPQEGIALGLAAWHGKMDILNMLLSEIQCSTPALIPVRLDDDPNQVEIPPTPHREELESFISKSLKAYFPIWHREPEERTQLICGSPLTLSIWSPECLDRLLQSNFYADRLTISVAVCYGDVKLVEKLVNIKRMDNSHADRPGPLYLSVERRSEEMTRVLLKANIDPSESNYLVEFGRSPLQKAVEDGNLEMIDLLLQAGADVNTPAAKNRGATALQLAAITGRLGIAKRLIDLKANVNAPGAETHGRTALEGAAEHGRLDMVQLLLDCGANVVGSGRLQYLKAIRFAKLQGHKMMADFLTNLRAWTTFDHEIWGRVIRLERDYWGEMKGLDRLEEFIANSAESPSSNYEDGDSQEETARLDGNSDSEYDTSLEESFHKDIVVRKEDARVEGGPVRHEDSSAAIPTGARHENMIMEDFLVSHIHDQSAGKQQVENTEDVIQTLRNDSPIGAVHGDHAIQSSETLGIYGQLDWDQQSGWANQEHQASWEPMLIGELDNDVTMEEQVLSVMGFETTWNRQLGAIDCNDPQIWLGTEFGSGNFDDVLEGDMDWIDTTDRDA